MSPYAEFMELAAADLVQRSLSEASAKLPPLFKIGCPDCFHDIISPQSRLVQCGQCKRWHSWRMLDLMGTFGPQRAPWITPLTQEDQDEFRREWYARFYERQAQRMRGS
jgi:hypothetical protein